MAESSTGVRFTQLYGAQRFLSTKILAPVVIVNHTSGTLVDYPDMTFSDLRRSQPHD